MTIIGSVHAQHADISLITEWIGWFKQYMVIVTVCSKIIIKQTNKHVTGKVFVMQLL